MQVAAAQGNPCECGPEEGCGSTFLDVTNFYEGPPPNIAPGLTISIPRFDPSQGTLKKVEYAAVVRLISASSSFENTNAIATCSLTGITFVLNNFVQAPTGVTPVQMFPTGASFDCSVSPINIQLGVAGSATDTFVSTCSPPEPTPVTSSLFDICSDENQISVFSGPGNVLFPIGTIADQGQQTDCSNIDPDFNSAIRVTILVRYTFCPPQPVLLDRKVIKAAGSTAPIVIPIFDGSNPGEGCEFDPATTQLTDRPEFGTLTPGPGNAVTYTPGNNFPAQGEDTFCFSIETTCGCLADACVEINEAPPEGDCNDRNRRNCGSLLLFPEYNNTPGHHTLYTITYGCCDDLSTDLWVELIYIDAEDSCTEENRTIRLTPCDTFTFLTEFQAPPAQQGYMYAFAKAGSAPGATPIVANKLIGSLFQIHSLEALNLSFLTYTMNAVSFKGVGNGEGSATDLDGDGVKDLDGDEYEEAPDQILIPSFLGQDASDLGISSDLILIALSGGAQFETRVLFAIYDDNENATSATYPFRCWTKVRLRDISGAFLETALEQNDNPAEIAGAPSREAGWIRIDGQTASSGFETINDPAIYAVLIQQHFYALFSAADLPFELCSQINGDLLPESVFGDPRPGAPSGIQGDNQ
jgi:hypothetical protein